MQREGRLCQPTQTRLRLKRTRGRPKKQPTVGKKGNLDRFLTKAKQGDQISLEHKLKEGNAGAEKFSTKIVNDIELISFESETEYEPDATIIEDDEANEADDNRERVDFSKKEIEIIKVEATKLKRRVTNLEFEMKTERRKREKERET